jgi:hypothetical protein
MLAMMMGNRLDFCVLLFLNLPLRESPAVSPVKLPRSLRAHAEQRQQLFEILTLTGGAPQNLA